ncbi:low density lipoprotein receptor adapter protein 1-A-like [Mizuhopecten yessoensis]|uniref:Low density lipoprotein receptor adapter protein 1 n=1 Tax=Mizuhopecten yessoensis TaxID=6573 RepID=A0A210PRQ5_MIZYE|nr:low density lipoprotein receptor adapter protein 1-A-like [Mizuhopecten yessoensis]OWF39169.1 Low density lipoprotein receptor adapter protein 1 [Mizuhopecten yessoensis]
MDALRRAMKKSPNVLRDGFGKSRHKKLAEGYNENKEAVKDGLTFYMKYLGSTLVEEADDGESYGDGASTKAVQSIVTMAKAVGKKLKKVALTASPSGIQVVDMLSKEILQETSIYRISFCSADKNHDKVFAYMARTTVNETMECHAYLCPKKKLAEAVTLTVSKAFELAHDQDSDWGNEKTTKTTMNEQSKQNSTSRICDPSVNPANSMSTSTHSTDSSEITFPKLKSPGSKSVESSSTSESGEWQHFEEDAADDKLEDLDDDFSRLAENRVKPVPSLGTNLCQDDLDDSLTQYFDSNRCLEEFSRTKSMEDLLCL